MSEHQHYEFQTIVRPLTRREMSRLRACPDARQISPTRFVNHYEWGASGGRRRLDGEYFDAFVYVANWGTRQRRQGHPVKFPCDVHTQRETRQFSWPGDARCLPKWNAGSSRLPRFFGTRSSSSAGSTCGTSRSTSRRSPSMSRTWPRVRTSRYSVADPGKRPLLRYERRDLDALVMEWKARG